MCWILRKFDINSWDICPPHLCTVTTLPWEIPKSQQYYSHILQIIYIISEDNRMLLPYPSHLKNVKALPCKMHKFFKFFNFFSRVSSTNPQCGRVVEASCCDKGWISAERGGRCSWSVAKKTGSMYRCRRWSLWTFTVTLLVWHSICHTSQLVLFRATNANPQPALFQSRQRSEECNIPSVRWKVVHVTR